MYVIVIIAILIILILSYFLFRKESFTENLILGDQAISYERDPSNTTFNYISFKDNGILIPDPYVYTNKKLYAIN